MKIIHVIGARPQFIKYGPVATAIADLNKKMNAGVYNMVVHTGQHYDRNMSDVFFRELRIPKPDYHLNVKSGSHGGQTARIIGRTENVFQKEAPSVVVVYGDTNTTLGAALAAVKMHIPLAHVESGLRSRNKSMPEEVNRILTDHVSTVHFCTSENAVNTLKREGIKRCLNQGKLVSWAELKRQSIGWDIDNPLAINVGDVMCDVFHSMRKKALETSEVMGRLALKRRGYVLLTLHRAENTEDPEVWKRIVRFVNRVSKGKNVIFPMHPRTRAVYSSFPDKLAGQVTVIDPLPYLDMLALLTQAEMVLTDSGGLQKEAFWARVPCVTLRDETEWVETVDSGWNVLYGHYRGMPSHGARSDCYGDGHAAARIAWVLLTAHQNGAKNG